MDAYNSFHIFRLKIRKQEHFISIVTIHDNVTESGRKEQVRILAMATSIRTNISSNRQTTGRWNIRGYLYR